MEVERLSNAIGRDAHCAARCAARHHCKAKAIASRSSAEL